VLNPFQPHLVAQSVARTGRLVAVDDGWRNCGMAGEVIAAVFERIEPSALKARPARITLPEAPAPTSRPLEAAYYPTVEDVVVAVRSQLGRTVERLAEAV
jgi:pyruvate dehydrogenase E1 component beta subunit